MLQDESPKISGNLRVRVSGIVVKDESLLLVNLKTPILSEPYWMPPGGGLHYGETFEQGVKREILEETGIHVQPESLWYIHEYLNLPWHAVEFYFWCTYLNGIPTCGTDPERSQQYLLDADFIPISKLNSLLVQPAFLTTQLLTDLNSNSNQTPKLFQSK